MGRRHEVRDETTSSAGQGRIRAHAVPAAVIFDAIVLPQLRVLIETDVGER
jgi:hypothetical protein